LPATKRKNLGLNFEAYYFLGPSDVRAFFGTASKLSLGASIEEYFARKHSFDRGFRDSFAAAGAGGGPLTDAQKADWEAKRRAFLVFYSLRAGVGASLGLGSHDEWAIFRLLNQARRKVPEADGGGIPNQLAGFFDGKPLSMAAAEGEASLGYAR
jgi:hypothetical protein